MAKKDTGAFPAELLDALLTWRDPKTMLASATFNAIPTERVLGNPGCETLAEA